MLNNELQNSGALVEIKSSKTGKIVFSGYLLGQNSKTIIGIKLPYLENPELHIRSNFDSIKHLSQSDLESSLDTWLEAKPEYISFVAAKHEVMVLEPNKTDFKANIVNDIYDFKRNKWGEQQGKASCQVIPVTDNPMKPCSNVTVECLGGENIYFIINGLQCAVKSPNINGATYPFTIGIGRYNLVEDPNNPDQLNAELIESYDATIRAYLMSLAAKT